MEEATPETALPSFAEYADALAKAVPAYFDLLRKYKERGLLIPSMRETEDMEIALGETILRLKREDVGPEEKRKRVRAAGDWLKSAYQIMSDEIFQHMEAGYIGTIDQAEMVKLHELAQQEMRKLIKVAALNDRFEEQWNPLYQNWQTMAERKAAFFPSCIEALQTAQNRLARYTEAYPERAGDMDVAMLHNVLDPLISGFALAMASQDLERSMHPAEQLGRADNFLEDPAFVNHVFQRQFDIIDQGWNMGENHHTPITDRLYKECRRALQQALDKAYPIDPISI